MADIDHFEDIDVEAEARKEEKRRKRIITIAVTAGVVVLLLLAAAAWMIISQGNRLSEERDAREQLELENQMLQSANEFAQLENEYSMLENQTQLLANDSLVEKYTAARAQIEKLMDELKNEKNKNREQVAKLQAEIETLKGILRDYTVRINELMAENEGLRDENQTVKNENQQLNQQVRQITKSNQQLSERMTLAEKLNVTGVTLTALNNKGKKEKNITKARKLMVSFTIPQNNSTPPGEKTIYLVITTPEGNRLAGNGTFTFEGTTQTYTAMTRVDYANEEIGGVTIYWDVNTTLNQGDYRVELFADNYILANRTFTMQK